MCKNETKKSLKMQCLEVINEIFMSFLFASSFLFIKAIYELISFKETSKCIKHWVLPLSSSIPFVTRTTRCKFLVTTFVKLFTKC